MVEIYQFSWFSNILIDYIYGIPSLSCQASFDTIFGYLQFGEDEKLSCLTIMEPKMAQESPYIVKLTKNLCFFIIIS